MKNIMSSVRHQSLSDGSSLSASGDLVVVDYDKYWLVKARVQWSFGDWKALLASPKDQLLNHPDRAELALLTAAAALQAGDIQEARLLIDKARDWGCGRELMLRIIVSGVYNSLGRVAVSNNQMTRAQECFTKAISIADPNNAVDLLMEARSNLQIKQVKQALITIEKSKNEAKSINKQSGIKDSKVKTNISEKTTKFSTDAAIDEFIKDIYPYFKNKKITYVDIGAYIGEVFIKLKKTKKLSIREAHLIEPNPSSYEQLKENINPEAGFKDAYLYNYAVTDKHGQVEMLSSKTMSRVLSSVSEKAEGRTGVFRIPSRTLTELSKNFTDRRIHLLKIDVEGSELVVLKGAIPLLENQLVDVIYLEVGFNISGTQQTYFGDIDKFLQTYKYRVFKIYEQTREWIDNYPVLRRCNVAYMSADFYKHNINE